MAGFDELSIVVPIGPDDPAWRGLLNELAIFGNEPEILLSACRPPPEYVELPENVRWLEATQGRARQLNFGAKQSTRRVLWFVHADSRLNDGVVAAVRPFFVTNELKLGYFQLQFGGDGPGLTRVNAWAANRRSRLLGLPFGDQGFILDRSLFERLQGFDETVEPGEDLDFVVRLRAAGFKLWPLPAVLTTSARRYRRYGWLATTLRHLFLTWRLTLRAKRRLRSVG